MSSNWASSFQDVHFHPVLSGSSGDITVLVSSTLRLPTIADVLIAFSPFYSF